MFQLINPVPFISSSNRPWRATSFAAKDCRGGFSLGCNHLQAQTLILFTAILIPLPTKPKKQWPNIFPKSAMRSELAKEKYSSVLRERSMAEPAKRCKTAIAFKWSWRPLIFLTTFKLPLSGIWTFTTIYSRPWPCPKARIIMSESTNKPCPKARVKKMLESPSIFNSRGDSALWNLIAILIIERSFRFFLSFCN